MTDDPVRKAKDKLKAHAKSGTFSEIRGALEELLALDQGASSHALTARLAKEAAGRLNLPSKKIAFLTSFTFEPVTTYLQTCFFLKGWNLEAAFFPYSAWITSFAEGSELTEFDPSDVFLLLHPEDVLSRVAGSFLATNAEERRGDLDVLIQIIGEHFGNFRKLSKAHLVAATFANKYREPERFFGRDAETNRRLFLEEANQRLNSAVSATNDAYVYPYSALVADFGATRFFDPISHDDTLTSIHAAAYPALSRDLARYFDNLWRPRLKCIALDLDNVLWGGVIGEDGIGKIQLDFQHKGKAFRDFQLFLKELQATGILLAINSKNNLEDAKEVFDSHPATVLKWNDFSSIRVNWTDKAQNLREIATELNIGLDSILFVDDSPTECERVRMACPTANVVLCAGDPHRFPELIRDAGPIEPLRLTADDLARNETYVSERARKEASTQFKDYDSFVETLGLKLTMMRAKPADVPRLAQLAGKTNQFNTTTIRYSEADVAKMVESDKHVVLSLALVDKFGDYGTIGMVVVALSDKAAEIECFLMSCRVLGRKVEDTVIASLQAFAKTRKAAALIGYFNASKKNAQVADLYTRFGFDEEIKPASFEKGWKWNTSKAAMPLPKAITLVSDLNLK